MEYTGLKCPVCEKEFKSGDDIVVCPECGAPHHRECYEIENKCAYADRHGDDFEYDREKSEENADVQICPVCKAANDKSAFYCSRCGSPLGESQSTQQNTGSVFSGANPFSASFDPMGGVNPNEDMGDNVTAGELSKYVKNNTPYFMRVFSNLKNLNKGRFNFCAFIFNGFYLLYRKMYVKGAIFTAVILALLVTETYIQYSPSYTALEEAVKAASVSGDGGYFAAYNNIIAGYQTLEVNHQVMLMIMALSGLLRFLLQIFIAIYANRWYFRHCKESIRNIRGSSANPSQDYEIKGGVNLPLAISMYAIYFGVTMIPQFLF